MNETIYCNKEEIKAAIPHRHPFLMIDEITALEEGVSCASRKFVDPQDPVFQGHFPGSPVMPGVLIVENMAQTACFLLSRQEAGSTGVPVLAKINKCNFNKMVLPGDTLETQVTLTRQLEKFSIFAAESHVDGKRVARCELVVSRAEVNETQEVSDVF